MDNWIYILIMAVVVFIFMRWRNKQITGNETQVRSLKPHGKFHCVHIKYPANACQAVKNMDHTRRFLATEAPVLPVPGCTASKCECSYIHHEDRRVETIDRRHLHSLKSDTYPKEEDKRDVTDRRKNS